MFAVSIKSWNSLYFLMNRPDGDRWEVEEGVEVDIPPNYDVWPERAQCPQHVLCRSTLNPKHFKLFKCEKDVDRGAFLPTGKNFGGVFAKSTWERFAQGLLSKLARPETAVADPPGAFEEALRAIRGAR